MTVQFGSTVAPAAPAAAVPPAAQPATVAAPAAVVQSPVAVAVPVQAPVVAQPVAGPVAPVAPSAAAPGASPFMTGAEAQAAIAQEAKRAEEQGDRAFRFFLPAGGGSIITFLTGFIDAATGKLDMPTAYEHNLEINKKWYNYYICTQSIEHECAACETESRPYLAHYAVVIDHSKFTDGKGVVRQNELRLLCAKNKSRAQLEQIATQYGGLALRTFNVTRGTDKDAAIGNNFMYLATVESMEELKQGLLVDSTPEHVEKVLNFSPIEKMVPYKTCAELRALGIGPAQPATGQAPVGTPGPSGTLESQL